MKVLIVENEIYLAQSISSKLADFGYSCEIATNTKDALKDDKYDVVLLSTGLIGGDFYPIIKKHSCSIIILLISYISSDTVSNPIKAGADDYIQKPFMIEELVRKIKLFQTHKKYQILNSTYEKIIESNYKSYTLPKYDFKKIKLPLMIISQRIQYTYSYVYFYAKETNMAYEQISAISDDFLATLKSHKSKAILHITDFDRLSIEERQEALSLISNQKIIISATSDLGLPNFNKFSIDSNKNLFEATEIFTIDEYVKHIIACYQDIFPDTELSKRLGISRKSLWEKRKKYDIAKKK
ncbi:receiver domain protein [Campylobacter iguaniorum]|uniref:Receiver domain protein n=1 Tax=Campylobacter iguaniorum TaxID=1244531 RepID=A0A076F9J2_9BACT|nr:response regulator [Campylobacter iguaniorum]AII14333.1 receiver domain protein [Campylobacter iguaniorum]ALV24068.1 receiver domain protein [Campylobacter iguaniorum]ANE35500.1 receiver domain protein [Campylobacter iguaniorum]